MRIVNLDSTCVRCQSIWQYDYGMVLRLQGAKLPTATEIHFSFNERGGQAKPRIGLTKDGVTDVVIPDTFVENDFTSEDYKIYVFVYLTDENSGRTEYKITIPVKSRPELEAFDKPEDAELFHEAINEVNKSAESASESARQAQTAKDESVAAAKEAKQSAEEASTSTQEAQTSANASKESASVADSAAKAAISAKEIAVSAANSADNNALAASRSAQEAKQSAEQADTAAKNAAQSKQDIQELKTAIDNTAEKIATDRTAVETDKKEVQKAKSSVEDLKEAVEQKSSEAITDINTAKDSAITDVNTAKDTAVSAVTQEKELAVNTVNEAKDAVVEEINRNENVQQIQKNKDSVEELQDSLSEIATIGKNQFNITDLTNEFYSNDGTLTDNSNYLLTGFCDVSKKQGYYIASSYNGYYVQFDEDRKFIKKTDNILYNNNRRIESGTAYIRIGIGKNISEIKDEALWIEKEKITETPVYDEYGKSINDDVKIPLDMDELNKPIKELKKDIDQLNDKKITKFYANSLGEMHLQDSDNGKIQDMFLYGKSEQKQYNGYQMFSLEPQRNENIPNLPFTTAGVTINKTDDGIGFIVTGTNNTDSDINFCLTKTNEFNIKAGTYTRRGKGLSSSALLISGGSNSNGGCFPYRSDASDFAVTETVNDGLSGNYIIRIPAKATVNTVIYFQIEEGSIAHDFEPYVGGIPSPNPNYPQEIRSVINPVVKIIGKNLLDVSKIINKTINGVEFTPKTDGALIVNGTATNNVTYNIVSNFAIKAGTYAIKGCKAYYRTNNKTGWLGTDKNTFTVATFDSDALLNILIFIPTGTTISETLKPMLIKGNTDGEFEKYKEQIINLPYTLNSIPVSKNGNVTINGQQYVSDYIDIERGKLIKCVAKEILNTKSGKIDEEYRLAINVPICAKKTSLPCVFSKFIYTNWETCVAGNLAYLKNIKKQNGDMYTAQELKEAEIEFTILYQLDKQEEIDLTQEEIKAFKELATYYPVTNVSVASDQLDGYITFNYPISMKNGWDYVKQQLNDNRDYIYDMDVKTQDIDTQSAEAYVNSEYAVALTELEVM